MCKLGKGDTCAYIHFTIMIDELYLGVGGDPGAPGEGGAGGARLVTLAPLTTAGTQSRLGVVRPARLMIFYAFLLNL